MNVLRARHSAFPLLPPPPTSSSSPLILFQQLLSSTLPLAYWNLKWFSTSSLLFCFFFFKLFYFFTFIYFSWEKKKDRKRTNMSRDVSDLSSFPRKSYCCHAVASDLSRLTLVAFAFQSSPCLVSLSLHLALRASPCLASFRFQVVELHAIAPILSPSFQLPKFCAAAVNRLCFIPYWIFRIRVCLSSPLFYCCVVACCFLVTKIVSES